MKTNTRTIVLAMAISLAVAGTAANAAVAVDTVSGEQIATTFSQNTDINLFGKLDSNVAIAVNDEIKAITDLATFFGPSAKTVLVRYQAEYNTLKAVALKHKVTTPERLAETEVVSVTDKAAMLGIGDIDAYALIPGPVSYQLLCSNKFIGKGR